jgi:DNA-directed RNA polymerase subunit M/transcription elongation factor TFIIS
VIFLEFCPKCGKLLIPNKKEEKIFLICRNCGFEKPASESKGYKILQPVDENKRRKTLVVEEPQKKGQKRKEEERELVADFYEVFLENFQEEGGEGEETSTEETETE